MLNTVEGFGVTVKKNTVPHSGIYSFWSQMGKFPNHITSPSRQHSKLKTGVLLSWGHKGRAPSLLPGSCPERPGVCAESQRMSTSGLAEADEAGILERDTESVWDSMTHSGNSGQFPMYSQVLVYLKSTHFGMADPAWTFHLTHLTWLLSPP